jgi:hypothetical protein
VLHCHVQPYAHWRQNMLETVLTSFSILAVFTGCIVYVYHKQLSDVSISVSTASIVGMLLGPLIVFGVWTAVGGRGRTIQPAEMREWLLRGADSTDLPLGTMSINTQDLLAGNILVRPSLVSANQQSQIRQALLRNQQEVPCNPRYTADATDLLLQGASEAAVGVASQLGLTDAELHERMLRGVAAIVDEFEAHLVQTAIANTGDVLSCVENLHRLEDVLHEPANCSEMQALCIEAPTRDGLRLSLPPLRDPRGLCMPVAMGA